MRPGAPSAYQHPLVSFLCGCVISVLCIAGSCLPRAYCLSFFQRGSLLSFQPRIDH